MPEPLFGFSLYCVGSSDGVVVDDFSGVCFVVDFSPALPAVWASARVRDSSEVAALMSYLKCFRKLRPSVACAVVLAAGRMSHATFFAAKLPTRTDLMFTCLASTFEPSASTTVVVSGAASTWIAHRLPPGTATTAGNFGVHKDFARFDVVDRHLRVVALFFLPKGNFAGDDFQLEGLQPPEGESKLCDGASLWDEWAAAFHSLMAATTSLSWFNSEYSAISRSASVRASDTCFM